MSQSFKTKAYIRILSDIKKRIRSAQSEALRAVNRELIALYWDIGRIIVERQNKTAWGKAVVESLAGDLQKEFPGIAGFSARNIWNMRNFYVSYSLLPKLQPLAAEISWTHNLIIMERCKDGFEREFYIRMTRKFGWSKNVLIHQIENKTYEKTILSQTNFDQTLPPALRHQAKLAVKDEYTFDFLELGQEHNEATLERAMTARMGEFLREMGGAVSFVGNQYRVEVGGREYFVDILLYHRHLRCLIVLELKAGEFLPEYVGKMQFYLTAVDRHVRAKGENPPIGIIVCKSKDKTVVEYALADIAKPIGVASYHLTARLPKDLKEQLPAPEQVARFMEGI
jgi:predicted nuclease of restriction endonuclease-like (RecB) superfamily